MALTEATRRLIAAAQAKADRENKWFATHFPAIITVDAPTGDRIYAVNFKGIIDDMLHGSTYENAVKKNSATVTGLIGK